MKMFDIDLPVEVLEKMPSYYDAPKNCPMELHQSIMRKLYHSSRVIKYSHNIINFN